MIQTAAYAVQLPWTDILSREALAKGQVAQAIADGALGMSTSAAVLFRALISDPSYRSALPVLRSLHSRLEARYETLLLPDVRQACSVFAAVHAQNEGRAGFVSMGLPPGQALPGAALRLWDAIGRPNAMISLPASPANVAALEDLLLAGVHIELDFVFTTRQLDAIQGAVYRAAQRGAAGLCVAGSGASRQLLDPRVDGAGSADTIGNDLLEAGLRQYEHAFSNLLALLA